MLSTEGAPARQTYPMRSSNVVAKIAHDTANAIAVI